MRGLISISTLSLLATLVTAPAQALEFRSVGATPVIMYDAPSVKGGKVYVAPRGMPVEVIFTSGAWSKVRDMAGDLSWVESKDLITRRNLIVRVANAKIRASADDSAALVFSAEKNVLLEMAEPASAGWVKVRHRDGQLGYVKVNEVWGL
ncbi:SH3 domain-containing protein [Undibacterium sp. 14-3-2]|uniref:SH3 domain-containing protein n=1 Tax=Undibacterium sp. 14-3-2 TaxID=2800129 RepID=UPI001908AA03|nr:SH3 domain-containing protein [Undibacterium sp. 14-3-2]MBK1890187.1 SH3 domain-containing protein [Undibacterium sp. 14-3-2]